MSCSKSARTSVPSSCTPPLNFTAPRSRSVPQGMIAIARTKTCSIDRSTRDQRTPPCSTRSRRAVTPCGSAVPPSRVTSSSPARASPSSTGATDGRTPSTFHRPCTHIDQMSATSTTERTVGMSRDERLRLAGFGAAIAVLHLVGWGLFLYYSSQYRPLVGLGLTAYLFGLRHAFDADHIAAIDNTTRKLLQQGRRPMGVGFFFSLGHSTIVFALVAGLALATRTVHSHVMVLHDYGGSVGAGVSGVFLWLIGILNLIVLIDIVRIFREMRGGHYDNERLENRLLERGMMSRCFGRFFRLIDKSWQMYPLGVLFGLGFDTATEVGLLAVAAGVATQGLSIWSILVFPALFTAGMTLIDTTDSILMLGAYGWAFVKPIRKQSHHHRRVGDRRI